jgi:uncharacterized membrane protein YfcA
VGFIILTFSRVLLAMPDKNASTALAIIVATIITAIAFLIAYRPKVSGSALAWMLAIGAVVLFASGIIGGVVGERDVEHHEEEHAPAAEDAPAEEHSE